MAEALLSQPVCRMGGAKEARHSCRVSKAIPINRSCEDDGFREGLNHPTGYKVMREFCDDPRGFVEAAIAE
jgi:hypothetical protein